MKKLLKPALAFLIFSHEATVYSQTANRLPDYPFARMSYYSLHHPERLFPLLDSLEVTPATLSYHEVELLRDYAREEADSSMYASVPDSLLSYGQLYAKAERLDRKMSRCLLNQHYAEAWKYGLKRGTVLDEMEKKAPGNDPSADFERGILYGKMACLAFLMGNAREAANYELMFYHTKMSKSVFGEGAINDYLILTGRYGKAMENNRRRKSSFLKKDTVCLDYIRMLAQNTRIYRTQGDTEKAYENLKRICRILYRMNERQRNMLVESSAALYQKGSPPPASGTAAGHSDAVQELMPLWGWKVLTGILGAMLLCVSAWHFLKKGTHLQALGEAGRAEETDTGSETGGTPESNDDLRRKSERELYGLFCEKVEKQKIYLNPHLGRDDYAELMGVGKNRFAQILQNEGHTNLKSFLNNLRLSYAKELLETRPELSVKGVSMECGIPKTSTFYRLFKEKYGYIPTQYRKRGEKSA